MKYSVYFFLCFGCFHWHSLALKADRLWAKFLYYDNANLEQSDAFDSKIVYSECRCKAWCVSEDACMAYFGVYLDNVRVMCHLSSKSIFDTFPSQIITNGFYASKFSTETHPTYRTNFWLESDGNIYWRTILGQVNKTEAEEICSFHENSSLPIVLTDQELQAGANIENRYGVYHTGLMKRNGGEYWTNNVSYGDTEISNASLLWTQNVNDQNCFRFDEASFRDISCGDKHFVVCQMKIPKA